jgi:hypothetical protein
MLAVTLTVPGWAVLLAVMGFVFLLLWAIMFGGRGPAERPVSPEARVLGLLARRPASATLLQAVDAERQDGLVHIAYGLEACGLVYSQLETHGMEYVRVFYLTTAGEAEWVRQAAP